MKRLEVPVDRLRELEQVRSEGAVNMWDRQGVMVESNRLGFYRLVILLNDHPEEYPEILRELEEYRRIEKGDQ